MNRRNIITAINLVIFVIAISGVVFSQESVLVPQDIQEQVEEFNLNIERLNVLQASVEKETEQFLNRLKVIRKNINKFPKGSKKRRLEVNRYRSVLSEYLANTYEMLDEMQKVRDSAIDQLTNIISQINEGSSPALQELGHKLIETQERVVQLEKKQVILATIIKYGLEAGSKEGQLKTELDLIRRYETPVLQQLSERLQRLEKIFTQGPGTSWKAYKNHLTNILTQLKYSRWIDSEKIYIETLAALDNERLQFEQAVSSIIGLIEKFKDYVAMVNNSIGIRKEMNIEIEGPFYQILQEEIPVPEEIPSLQITNEISKKKSQKSSSSSQIDQILESAKIKYKKGERP